MTEDKLVRKDRWQLIDIDKLVKADWNYKEDNKFLEEQLIANIKRNGQLENIKRPGNSELHPTMKPIEACVRGIINSSHMGDIVLDLFGGSGSTLIAAERTGRKCYMAEIDPRYCDIIVERWEKETGRKAEKWEGSNDE